MDTLRSKFCKIFFVDNFSFVKHNYAIGIIKIERLAPTDFPNATDRMESNGINPVIEIIFEMRNRNHIIARDIHRWHKFTHMDHTVTQCRKLEKRAVACRQHHRTLRRQTLHIPHLLRHRFCRREFLLLSKCKHNEQQYGKNGNKEISHGSTYKKTTFN